ncbi:MAG: helix-turn-helix transcriptional regulator [Lachnospiraceae bacterium]|nr:helix-turn-helix transcriptional regulator [Lachnospiraceae bacterium]
MIYSKIKEICKEKGMSITQIEKNAGLSNGAISKWNNASPTVDNLQSVAKVLGCKVDDLLNEEVAVEGR